MSDQLENQVVSSSPSIPSTSSSSNSFGLSSLDPFHATHTTTTTTIDSTADSNDKVTTNENGLSVPPPPPEMIILDKEHTTTCSVALNDSKDYICKFECIQHVEYHLNTMQTYNSHQLGLLDVILNNSSSLTFICSFYFNGLDALMYPRWFQECLVNCMEKYGFTLHETSSGNHQNGVYQFTVERAFVNAPLSYVLGCDAPHGVLQTMELVFDWTTEKSGEFLLDWNSNISEDFAKILEIRIARSIFPRYPLIFSGLYVTRLAGATPFLHHISTCLKKVLDISKVYSETDFYQSVDQVMKTTSHRTTIMHPGMHKASTSTDFLIGLYHSVKTETEKKTKTLKPKPPDAINTVSRIWSVSCSTSTSLY